MTASQQTSFILFTRLRGVPLTLSVWSQLITSEITTGILQYKTAKSDTQTTRHDPMNWFQNQSLEYYHLRASTTPRMSISMVSSLLIYSEIKLSL
jgi:hypothetical protein